MRFGMVLFVAGALTLCVGLFMLPALFVSWLYGGEDFVPLAEGFAITVVFGGALTLLFRRVASGASMNHREGMAVTALTWIAAGLFGALPFYLSGQFGGLTNSAFESFSGFTTTGASILTDIEAVPHGLLFWRALTHWLGGMGIIVLSLAILPFLGVGGMQLYKAEVPGPTPDKLKPRIKDTALALWKVYVLLSAVQTVLLLVSGMDLFDALCHTFATMATGGFSTRNASLGAFSPMAQYVSTVFMLLAGMNFALHYRLFTGRPGAIWRDPECRTFFAVFILGFAVIAACLYGVSYTGLEESARHAAFQAASILTTTGFSTADYELWAPLAQVVLLVFMFVGGSAGSTAGGIKVMRFLVMGKAALREIKRLIHPHGVYQVKLGGRVVPEDVLSGVWGFFVLWLALFVVGALLVALSGVDVLSSIGASIACMGNIGPGFGLVGPAENYAFLPDAAKWALMGLMVLGRLEVFTIVILLVPEFWRK